MAGHSKWANIKHRKGKSDAKKGKIFSRISKEIISAVKLGGVDQKSNTRLRLALTKAREANVPNDNIDRLIKKASSDDQAAYVPVTYELYGHGGVGILVEAMTDNKNRTASDMRIATNKRGGTIATPGAVAFNFTCKGVIEIPKGDHVEDDLFLTATELGVEDFEVGDELYLITTDPQELITVTEGLKAKGYANSSSELEMIPKSYVACDPETLQANLALVDWLEALEDVDAVYHNIEAPPASA